MRELASAHLSSCIRVLRRLSTGRHQLALIRGRLDRFPCPAPTGTPELQDRELLAESDVPSLLAALATAAGESLDGLQLRSTAIRSGNGTATLHLLHHQLYRPGAEDPLVSLVEKVIEPSPERSRTYLWAQEALVYAERERFEAARGVRLPECYGLSFTGRRIHLYIEDLGGCTPPRSWRQLLRSAEALGRFGAWAAGAKLWKAPWILRSDESKGIFPVHWRRVEKGLERLGVRPSSAAQFLEGCRLVNRSPIAQEVARSSPKTLVHLDAHPGNILLPKNGEAPYLLDWANIARGRLGDDLLRLTAPREYLLHQGSGLKSFLAMEVALLNDYLEGVRAEKAIPTSDEVRAYFYLRSLLASVRWLERGARLTSFFGALKPGERERRLARMEELLLLQKERVMETLSI